MRKISLLFFIVLLGILSIPYFVGYQFKKNFISTISTLNLPNNIKIEVLEYHLGWLSSDAKLKMSLLLPPQGANSPDLSSLFTQTMNIDGHIQHGPLVKNDQNNQFTLAFASIVSKINFYSSKLAIFSKSNSILYTLVDFKNNWRSVYEQLPASITIENIGIVSNQGSSGSIDFNSQQGVINKVDVISHTKSFALNLQHSSHVSEISADALDTEWHTSLQHTGYWNSDIILSIPTVTIKETNQEITIAKNSKFSFSTPSTNPQQFSINMNLAIQSLQTADKILPVIGPLQLSFAIKNINKNDLLALDTFVKSIKDHSFTPEERETYISLFSKILTPNSVIIQDMSTNTPLGTIRDDLNITWNLDKIIRPISVKDLILNTHVILNLHAETSFVDQYIATYDAKKGMTSTPQIAVPQNMNASQSSAIATNTIPNNKPDLSPNTAAIAPTSASVAPSTARQTFDAWLAKGYITKSGNSYNSTIEVQEGVPTINGIMPQ